MREVVKWKIPNDKIFTTAAKILEKVHFEGTAGKITENYLKSLNEVINRLVKYNEEDDLSEF